jgi:bifunctional UDP-N-acetylglucosamine pyrophosphorylase/glucosamine-1-phosphate N-acetyltransferase
MPNALILLAAGQGTRMQSDLPKVLHQLAGAPLLHHAMQSAAPLAPEETVVVIGTGADQVEASAIAFDPTCKIAHQTQQLGTAHAVAAAKAALDGFKGDAIVLYGDTPLIRPETLENMMDARAEHDVIVLGFNAADPARYGRLVMGSDGLERIVEYKDATDQERQITLCNSGIVAADAATLFRLIDQVENDNEAGEYYLPDIVALARTEGLSVTATVCDEAETLGVNTRTDLAKAEAAFQVRARRDALANGITLQAPDTVYFALDTHIGRDTLIEPNVVFGTGVTVETGATIRAFSHLEGCHVSRGAVVGPYARLRPGTELSENTKIGNFVEVKNATIAEGSKVNHLSYIGDAAIGEATNIGAGTITCNYDGVMKHKTTIGADVFIGSNTMLVAPVTVANDAMTASGSVITSDVPEESLAVARGRQDNKPGLARKLFEKLRAQKAKKERERS